MGQNNIMRLSFLATILIISVSNLFAQYQGPVPKTNQGFIDLPIK